jgi:hypothetical protein
MGMMAPGLPQRTNDLVWRVGRLMNYGDGIYGGMFVAGMCGAAFFGKDPHRIVEAGLACIPTQSPYDMLTRDVLEWSRQYPKDWKKGWPLIEQKWNRGEPCPEGALRPFNIDANINGACVALGLLSGAGDFEKTLEITTRSGQDSDCSPSTACGILGVMTGYRRIPEKRRSGIPAIADGKFSYTDFTFRTIVVGAEKRAIELVKRNGGYVRDDQSYVKVHSPVPARLEVWDDYGTRVERNRCDDGRCRSKGERRSVWDHRTKKYGYRAEIRFASREGAEVTISFQGTGAILTGPYLPAGGKADVYLDGKFDRTVDVRSEEDKLKKTEAVWHAVGLPPGKHVVRLVVRGEPFAGSNGTDVGLEDLIIFF